MMLLHEDRVQEDVSNEASMGWGNGLASDRVGRVGLGGGGDRIGCGWGGGGHEVAMWLGGGFWRLVASGE